MYFRIPSCNIQSPATAQINMGEEKGTDAQIDMAQKIDGVFPLQSNMSSPAKAMCSQLWLQTQGVGGKGGSL